MRPAALATSMQYRMRDDLFACVIGDHAIFLDIDADRYFRLPEDLEHDFVAHARTPDCEAAASRLLARNILVPAAAGSELHSASIGAPMRSAQEMAGLIAGSGIAVIPEVAATLWTCRRALRAKPFKDVLRRIADDRDQRCRPPHEASDPESERKLLHATSLFHNARPYVPIAPCCLPDSLALSRFLARRRLHSRIVLGVTCEPFSAHCWVQAGDIALNETVGDARAHTVIRVV